MSKRFVVDKSNIFVDEEQVVVKGDEVHHINVLRYKVGDTVYINEYELNITKLTKDILEGEVIGRLPQKGIPHVNITLIQSYLKSDKMDYVVQKAVELGVKNIIPVITKNTIVKMDEKDKVKKLERLSKIAKEAVEQCGRADMVSVENVHNIAKVDFSKYDKVLVCHETSTVSLKETIDSIREESNIAVIVGPEGGLDNKEVKDILQNNNAIDISLGERILRAETASLAILSILSYELD
ncbi:MAG: 16S rRNA (uracil(1498)-N(3))-methyltransferase [Clostridia bacterium]|nr:16S rRNA (uracil(1498)-N(3))-methyltransferase [Clostridia bacterium]